MKRGYERLDDIKRVNDVLNRNFNKKKSKCCNARVVYITVGGLDSNVGKRCTKCNAIIKNEIINQSKIA